MIKFTVFGKPQPAGSKRAFIVAGKARVTDANKKAKPWKQEVAAVAASAMQAADARVFDGPLQLRVTFFRQRPKGHYVNAHDLRLIRLSASGRRSEYPTTKPDATKLLRGLEDACTGIIWRDDAQIVRQFVSKVWGEPARAEVEVTEA